MTRSPFATRLSPLDIPLALFFAAALLGVLPAYDRASAILPLAALAGCMGLYLLVRSAARTQTGALIAARTVTALAAVMALFFITQSGHYDTLDKVGPLARLAGSIAAAFPALPFWTPLGNSMATLLEGLFFVSAGLFLVEKQRGWAAGTGICTGVIGLALLLSQSRGAWLALAAAGLLWAAVHFRPARWLALAAGVGLAGLAGFVLLQGDLQALERIPLVDRTLAPLFIRPDRLDVYRGSLYLLQDAPFTGIGLGQQFPMSYSRYVLLIQVPFLTYSHNFYLETWLQTGLLGLAALAGLVAALVFCAVRWSKNSSDLLGEAAWIGLAAMLAHGLTDARPYSDLWCWLPFFILAGLVSAGWLREARPARRAWIPAAAAAAIVLAVLFSLGSLPAAWQANLGSLQQARAELDPRAGPEARAAALQASQAHFQRSLAANPAQRSANLRLGLIELDQERFAQAVSHLETAHRADPLNPTAIKALGLAYTWNGQVEQAADMLRQTAGMAEELNTWAFWRAGRGQVELSRFAYRVSLRLNPEQPQVDQALRQLDPP